MIRAPWLLAVALTSAGPLPADQWIAWLGDWPGTLALRAER